MVMTSAHLVANVYNIIRLNDLEDRSAGEIVAFIRQQTELHMQATAGRIEAAVNEAIAKLEANGSRNKQPVNMLAPVRIPLSAQITRKEINDLDASVVDEMYADMTNRYADKSARYGTDWIDIEYERLRYNLLSAWQVGKWVDVANYAAMLHKRDKMRKTYPNS